MKNKTIVAVVLAVLALGFLGSKSGENKMLEVGKNYTISGGGVGVKGQITADLGGGWYQVKRPSEGIRSGDVVAVNLANAFFIKEEK